MAQLVLEGADDLTPVFEGLGVFDTKLEGELGDGHVLADDLGCRRPAGCILCQRGWCKAEIDAQRRFG